MEKPVEAGMRQYCLENNMEFLLWQCDLPENEGFDVSHTGHASHKAIWWQCEAGHKWKSTVSDRLTKKSGCPYCANKKALTGHNDLATRYPELAMEWHPEKNGSLTPEQVVAGSDKAVWWKCALGHEWKATVENRALKGQRCPYCAGKRAWPGYNDLATLHPELMEQWYAEYNRGLDPTRLRPASAKRVWWKCNEGHVWDAYVYSRTSQKRPGCPVCAGKKKAGRTGGYRKEKPGISRA